MSKVKTVFYKLFKLLSHFWAIIYVVIGARGLGKTYSAKMWLLSGWVYKREKFIILRGTIDECKTLAQDDGVRFWGDVLLDKKWKSKSIDITMTQDSVYINGELAGFVMPQSMFRKFKGSQYQDVKRVLYDEFIPEQGQRYNGDRAWQFINTLMTVVRFRNDFKIILTANALNKGDTILCDLFQFRINDYGIYKNRSKRVVLDYARNSEAFEAYQRQGAVYDLVKGSRFEKNLLSNEFLNDDTGLFYTKRKPCDLFGIYYGRDNVAIRIYQSKSGDEWYAGSDTNPNSAMYMRFAFDIKNANGRVRIGTLDDKKILQSLYKNQLIKFENSYILEVFKQVIG